MSDHAWMELCEVSTAALQNLEAQSLDAVCLQLPSPHPELTALILQAVPPSQHLPDDQTVYLHPLLYEFLMQAAQMEASKGHRPAVSTGVTVSIAPLPVKEFSGSQYTDSINQQSWTASRVGEIRDLPVSSCVSITCIYHEDAGETTPSSLERQLCFALEGRLIRTNTMLALPTLSGTYLVTVTSINVDEVVASQDVVYRVGNNKHFELDVAHTDSQSAEETPMQSEWDQECPGYEALLRQLITLSQLSGIAAPAGVLLTGCAGVGKSRLTSCLAHYVSTSHSMHVQWVSAQDLLVRASWATEADLLELLLPPTIEKQCLLVLDDLQILASEDEEDSFRDPELLLVHNSILEALARQSRITPSQFILGIAHAATGLPKELVRIGRLEKEIQMNPPTQVEREDILTFILQDVMDTEKRLKWAEALASKTAGCVASDLRRLSADAWTKAWTRSPDNNVEITWNDLRDAAHTCVPSQLAQLDVTKTAVYPNEEGSTPDPLQVHEWSWRNFGGYYEVKKRLYRTVVMPWHRFMATTDRGGQRETNQARESWVTPPSGVLFHGLPGVGKTLAASCLASSLGLHVVKVRASDVLDQWLGGSEAVIRSLFARARAASPCILFFDEIDAIACNREDDGSSVDVTSRILTTFLNEMDGISSNANGGVLVVACTNRPETLDAALLRPGRLDEHVLLPMPGLSDVFDMLKLHLKKVPLSVDFNITELAELLVELNASGADVEGVCRDACSRVIRDATPELSLNLAVSQNDIIDAIREWRK